MVIPFALRTARRFPVRSCLLTALVVLTVPLHAATVTFTADDSLVVANPERGFIGMVYPTWTEPATPTRALTQADCDRVKAKKYTVIGMRYCTWDWRNAELPTSFLNQIAADCALARSNGLKLNVRFQYMYASNNGENGYYDGISDSPISWVLKHIDQLTLNGSANNGPLLVNNDVIAYWDVGFIGSWGEEHGTTNELLGHTSSYDEMNDATRQIWNALLAKIPSDRMLATRYCAYTKQFFNGATLSAPAQTLMGRMGLHDDSFSANIDNYASFQYYSHLGSRVDELRAYASTTCRYTVSFGETYGTGPETKQENGNTVIEEMTTFSLDHYNGEHDQVAAYAVTLDKWRAQGLFTTMENKLGYRLNLLTATVPDTLSASSLNTVVFNVENRGYGKLYNPRPVQLLLCRKNGATYAEKYTITTTINPRLWLSATQHAESVNFALPPGAVAGTYDVLLALPDAYARLSGNPAYSVRIVSQANGVDVWNAALGANLIGSATITVSIADVNGDGVVDALDLNAAMSQFGRSGAAITPAGADVNGDGRVDATDLGIVTRNIGH